MCIPRARAEHHFLSYLFCSWRKRKQNQMNSYPVGKDPHAAPRCSEMHVHSFVWKQHKVIDVFQGRKEIRSIPPWRWRLAHLKQPMLREYNDLTTSKNLLRPTMILQPMPSDGNAPIAVVSGWNLSLCGTQHFEAQTVWKTTQYRIPTASDFTASSC